LRPIAADDAKLRSTSNGQLFNVSEAMSAKRRLIAKVHRRSLRHLALTLRAHAAPKRPLLELTGR
jgi:hypothetical protein